MTAMKFSGSRVELIPVDIEKDMEVFERWNRDSDYLRLLDDFPATQYSASMVKEWIEKDEGDGLLMMIRELETQKTIGFIELGGHDWLAHNAWVGIGIGEPDYRGKGYGTEAMNLILKFAFHAQNLHRVNLGVFGFNTRAVKSYEKCGFKYEGTEREYIFKEDQRWDMLMMGVLRSDWELLQSAA